MCQGNDDLDGRGFFFSSCMQKTGAGADRIALIFYTLVCYYPIMSSLVVGLGNTKENGVN